MRVESFLHTGSGAGFAEKLRPLTANALDALLLFSLGADHAVCATPSRAWAAAAI